MRYEVSRQLATNLLEVQLVSERPEAIAALSIAAYNHHVEIPRLEFVKTFGEFFANDDQEEEELMGLKIRRISEEEYKIWQRVFSPIS